MDAGPGHKPTDAPAGLTGGGTWALLQSRLDQQRLREGRNRRGAWHRLRRVRERLPGTLWVSTRGEANPSAAARPGCPAVQRPEAAPPCPGAGNHGGFPHAP